MMEKSLPTLGSLLVVSFLMLRSAAHSGYGMAAKKVVLVTTDWAPFSDKIARICEEEAKRAGVEFEIRKDDWIYLTRHGEVDELGGADVPQVFVESGTQVKHVLTRVPLDEQGKPDFEKARLMLRQAIESP